MLKYILWISFLWGAWAANAQDTGGMGKVMYEREYRQTLRSTEVHQGAFSWKMKKAGEVAARSEDVSTSKVADDDWMPAVVPGTVLHSLVNNRIYPEPYFGLNNKLQSGLIPDLNDAGRDFYTYWFRTEFDLPGELYAGKQVWLQADGINYRAEFWLNGYMVGNVAGMFYQEQMNITDYIRPDEKNILAVKVYPVDVPGSRTDYKSFGAKHEFSNGGNGEIGKNVTMLMTAGWDFNCLDGVRDRNTGIWRDLRIFTTGKVKLRHPFVRSDLRKPGYDRSRQTVSVEVSNPNYESQTVRVTGEIRDGNIRFEKDVELFRGEVREVVFTPEEFPQLVIDRPRLWWPVHKGKQELYDITFKAFVNGQPADEIASRFGIREITSDTLTPDASRQFRVNGRPLFIRGTNWIPENMLRQSDERMYAEFRYTAQSGINLIRLWGGGITESDYFFQLCDELGILVWTEFWVTGDTKHPYDTGLHLKNAASTVKRIRNHPSQAYYVCSNESTEVPHIRELIMKLDSTRGYQMQSETDGIHDGSPYKTVNVMRHYENTASDRGSRVDGFNPEYGAPCLPTVECLREMMDEKDLWPINREVWDYTDGNGFFQMSTLYADLTNEYGLSKSIDEFAEKGQFVGALNYKSISEVWNYNKLNYGDRYCSGYLFWYHNSPMRQVRGCMWDWSLEPTAALYAAQNANEPLHPQFDYLKNTVSVINEYPESFKNFKVTAEVYDLNMRRVFAKETRLDLPQDGVAGDVLSIAFPENITRVHFIKLRLFDGQGRQVGDNFYWRSTNRYEGKETLTGPATAGFQDIRKLAQTRIQTTYGTRKENGRHFIDLELKNTGAVLAFFTQLQWLDKAGKPVRPSYYTDNFLSLMPGESRKITIETHLSHLPDAEYVLVVRGYNVPARKYHIRI
jgi:mannosylglycoprotein endo-beta-mannosidase